MQLPNTFDITLLKKIPYLTKALYAIFTICLIGLFITSLYLFPVRSATDEIKAGYVILYVSDSVKIVSILFTIGLCLSFPLYFYLNKTEAAILTFLPATISIDGKNSYTIPISSIDKIYCSHIPGTGRLRKESLKLRIYLRHDKSIYFRLTHTLQIDEFMTQLTNYDNINLQLYNMDILQNPNEA